MNPITLIDGYKLDHRRQYPPGTEYVYSNWTPRSSRDGETHVVFVGLQVFLQKYLEDEFEKFFQTPREEAAAEYKRRVDGYLGPNDVGTAHIEALWDLGYVPLSFRALPEGSLVPLGVPMLTVENTNPNFAWLVNYIETLMSSVLWMPCTSATTARKFRKLFESYAVKTGSPLEFVDFQGHDFSFRGMPGPEAASLSGLGHLTQFVGTDTIPAIDLVEDHYYTSDDLVGASVAATEHSVMCAGGKDDETETYSRLLDLYPTGILSVVSDTWDLWKVLTETVPSLADKIVARDGKLVIRPDSGDPVKIIVGDPEAPVGSPAWKGVVRLLWDTFGGAETETGHIILDSHVGVIYGDGINLDRAQRILSGLAANGFASANVVFGLGSYTYQLTTRDQYGFAMKATWVQIDGVGYDMFKDPVTDDGGKKSAKGRLSVWKVNGEYALINQAEPVQEGMSQLHLVWSNGRATVHPVLFADVRERARA